MAVTWNDRKRAANLAKHGVDLAAAERFDFGSALLEDDFGSEPGERRFRAIGWLDGWLHLLVFTLDGAGLTGEVAVVTDGQLSGLVNKGIVVGEVSPEAAQGGALALVEDGDTIRIDVPGRTADLDVPDDELARRKADLQARPRAREVGWLSVYQRLVRPLPEGAVLRPRGTAP